MPNSQTFEAFQFNLPPIPADGRIDWVGPAMEIRRDTIVGDCLLSTLLPGAGDWSKGAVQSGQIPAAGPKGASFAVANIHTGDPIKLRTTSPGEPWLKGKRQNRGFVLVPEMADKKTGGSVTSRCGVKTELIIYTPPAVVEGVRDISPETKRRGRPRLSVRTGGLNGPLSGAGQPAWSSRTY